MGGVILFLNAHIDDQSFRLGLPIAIAGELVRLWASGFIERKGQKLATNGPFAHVRNPLYIGNFLIGLGIVLMARNPILLGIFLAGFAILYWGTVRKEEKDLRELFKQSYDDYVKEVPCLIPRLRPYSHREKSHYQWRLLLKHREPITVLGLALLITSLYVWEEIFIKREFYWRSQLAVGVGLVLIGGLAAEWIFRHRQKKNSAAPGVTRESG